VSATGTVRDWGRMVKFAHSVFALPFAFSGAALAAAVSGISWQQVGWIVLAMVGARNAAMGFNRLADEKFDARNPRTAGRALPAGRLSRSAVWGFTAALTALFVFAAFMLGALCGWLSLVAIALVFGYSYTKRFTWTCHLVLGLTLAMAPVGGWLAVDGHFAAEAWMMGLAVMLWVAGFDVVYASQDLDFDRRLGLQSIPARFGLRTALIVARVFHAAALAALAGVGLIGDLHPLYWVGWLIIAGLLVWEHRLVRADDLSRVGVAFFNMNGVISVIYLATILAAVWVPRLWQG